GGAYLHISKCAPDLLKNNAKNALSLFGSTSPSYLILASLDLANGYIENGYAEALKSFIPIVNDAKNELKQHGFEIVEGEELKIVIKPKSYGYYGNELMNKLEKANIYCEFADKDHTVLMLTPENTKEDIFKAVGILKSLHRRLPITEAAPQLPICEKVLTVRDSVFAESEIIDACDSIGRTVAQFNVACPPAVAIAVCGEKINESAVKCFEYYGINKVSVVKE
ncbi:MAG: amino acid decarboxylase, partial [Clostridia bacterium]|nr:amino acid decarboxylase [Clostridia bacterium]